MKEIVILGSTGSIGTQALEVVRRYPDRLRAVGLTCDKNIQLLERQIEIFRPRFVAVRDETAAAVLAARKPSCEILSGPDAVERAAAYPCGLVLNAVVGIGGLEPTLAAIESGRDVALANKETLVAGGFLVMRRAAAKGVNILPVDSEHSAIWQCLAFDARKRVRRLLLTASGGAFYGKTRAELTEARAAAALLHPTWQMGAKVTIDSATLMNKGLEIIEAMHLFGVRAQDISVVIQRQSVVHSMAEFSDGSVMGQMSAPDMRLPIQLALLYPARGDHAFRELDFSALRLDFGLPDEETFPCLKIAKSCAEAGGNACIVMNGANEALVPLYLKDIIKFYDIPYYISAALDRLTDACAPGSAQEILDIDRRAREFIRKAVSVQ